MAGSSEVSLDRAREIAAVVEDFVRTIVIPFERDLRRGPHGPEASLVDELRGLARKRGLMTPHILSDGSHLSQRGTALVLRASGVSPLGPVALNTMAPDEGNMLLLGNIGTADQKQRFLGPLVRGEARSAFFMTEPSAEGGAGSDPSMLQTMARREGGAWILNGRKAFITGADGARVGIIMAKTSAGPAMFLVALPHPAVRIERILNTIDGSMPGGHAVVTIDELSIPEGDVLGEIGAGGTNAQVRLSPARLSHCMRWLGLCIRAQEVATDYACKRQAFGRALIDHEGVGFMLAENTIELRQCGLMIDWCADVLDGGVLGLSESSMTKVAVSEMLYRIADRCVQVMGGTGVSGDTIVEQALRETRAFRIYDGPTEVHKWSLAKKIKRDWSAGPNGQY